LAHPCASAAPVAPAIEIFRRKAGQYGRHAPEQGGYQMGTNKEEANKEEASKINAQHHHHAHHEHHHGQEHCHCHRELAAAYIPYQKMGELFPFTEGLIKGTIFPELYRPYHKPSWPHPHPFICEQEA